MTLPTKLYTWDYTALRAVRDQRQVPDDQFPELLAAGYLTAAHGPQRRRDLYGAPEPKLAVRLADLGFETLERVEAHWEREVADTSWWSVTTNHGVLCLGIPDGLHPEAARGPAKRDLPTE